MSRGTTSDPSIGQQPESELTGPIRRNPLTAFCIAPSKKTAMTAPPHDDTA